MNLKIACGLMMWINCIVVAIVAPPLTYTTLAVCWGFTYLSIVLQENKNVGHARED